MRALVSGSLIPQGLVVGAVAPRAAGHAERLAALALI